MDLRTVLHDLADTEGTVMARSAPASTVEAQRVRARARRRRVIRTSSTAGAAAASVVIAVLAAQGLTTTPPVGAVPEPATSTERASTPAPSRPTPPTPQPTSAPTTTAPPSSAPVWPTSVGEEEVMYGGPGPWWVVWVAVTPGPDVPSDDPDALAHLLALGYSAAGTPVRCVVGSLEALGFDPAADPWGWPVYFRSEDDAATFVESWGRPVAGVVADVDLGCDWG